MADDAGFLSRWSRRKVSVRDGAVVPPMPPLPPVEPAPRSTPVGVAQTLVTPPVAAVEPAPAPAGPTLADVAELTRESDFTRFVAPGVDGDVKNAALKKLFGDPHFNVMDGLDTYIDDYGKPSPLPESVLRQMAQAKFLGLFSDEDDDALPAATPPATTDRTPTPPDSPAHEDTDLRLQPHDAAGRPGPEPGAGQDGGREH
jgi:hypothetical protein